MADEPKDTAPISDPGAVVPTNPVDIDDQSRQEFDLYEPERQELRKAELDAEKNYDTMMVTLSSLAIGVSLTILKDFIGKDKAVWLWSMGFACLAFVACLLLALLDKKLTFQTHREWRLKLDGKFKNWKPGAWDEALAEYHSIPGINYIDAIKRSAEVCLIIGIFLLSLFVLANVFFRSHADDQQSSKTGALTFPVPASPSSGCPNPTTSTPAPPAQVVNVNIGSVVAQPPATPATDPLTIANTAPHPRPTTVPTTKP